MSRKVKAARAVSLSPRLRIQSRNEIPLGPGKADLLALIGETASIREAAKRMDMSYMRAWTLIQTMNNCFKEPLIVTARGGEKGGGAQLSDTGQKVLGLYRQMNDDCQRACAGPWKELQKLLAE